MFFKMSQLQENQNIIMEHRIMKKLIIYISLVSSIYVIDCLAQDLPKTPAGTRAKEIIELMNGTSPYQLEDYISRY